MAVQGQPKERMCPQCFEINAAGATFCKLCGASLAEGKEKTDGSDVEVYRDLAQTNLLRMRGAYKEAITVCLGILKKYPNNATAHTLLGDVYAEMGELQQAAEWYEMALDLNPKSDADKKKLEAVKRRIHEREQAQTAEQIGLAQHSKPMPGLYIGLSALVILLVGGVAYGLGTMSRANAPKPAVTQQVGIKEPEVKEPAPDVKTGGSDNSQPEKPSNPAPSTTTASGPDKATVDFLRAQGKSSGSVVNATEDPRLSLIIVTAELDAQAGAKTQAALIAADVFTVLTAPTKATVRIVQGAQTVFVADAEKAAWTTAKAALTEGQTAADAADQFLTNTWPSSASASGP